MVSGSWRSLPLMPTRRGARFRGEAVAQRLDDALAARGWSQRELAGQLGISGTAVSKWLSGGKFEAWLRLADVCRALGLSADELLGLREPGDGSRTVPRETLVALAAALAVARELLGPYAPDLSEDDAETRRLALSLFQLSTRPAEGD